MLVTDLDGTLLDPAGKIHRSDAEAIALLLRRGTPVTICTGRMFSGTQRIAERLKLDGPVACVDGSHIVHVGRKDCLFSAALDRMAAESLRQLLANVDLATFVFAADAIVHDAKGQRFQAYLRTWSERMLSVRSVTALDYWATLSEISAVVALGQKADIDAVAQGLAAGASDAAVQALQVATFPLRNSARTSLWALLVRRSAINKGTATEWLANYHGVALAQVVAVGDWLNDVPMFRVVGKSYVMGQAPAEVKDAATCVLAADVQAGGGIREAAERSGLL